MDGLPDITKFITDPEIALLIILSLGAVIALAKGLVVPKPIYDREVKRADKADETNTAMLTSQRDMTEALKDLTAEVLRK